MSKNFYVTTTLPYVNASPHIGFGLEITEADVIARYQQMLGKEVIFNTGTDEHGQKIYQKAIENHQTPQEYCDEYAAKFAQLKDLLNLNYTNFIRTTDEHHLKAAQKFWQLCNEKGDIYKAKYKVKYCVGCELEKTESELVDGKCPLHPNQELETREEENYFFKFSKYQAALLDLYKKNKNFIKPEGKYKEMLSFVQQGLQDFSISRLKEKMPWGVAVPDDPEHVMYVWFDALVNYISTLGWPDNLEKFDQFWPGVQLAGKDNLRQQSAMWQAMLMSAGLANSQQILINGFISVEGQKMSKSLGNVISPEQMVARFGKAATRYLLINLGTFTTDMDVSWEKFDTTYTANLSNALGNLCSRVAKMCEKSAAQYQATVPEKFEPQFMQLMDNYDLSEALNFVMDKVSQADKELSLKKPWTLKGEEQIKILQSFIAEIVLIAYHLQAFMPSVAQDILEHFTQTQIKALKPLFPRLTDTK